VKDKIFKILVFFVIFKVVKLIILGASFLIFTKIALGQTIGIGVSPSVVKLNYPGIYLYEFCFFNQGDTDAIYETINGEVMVQYQRFVVPAGTNFTNCVKRQLLLTVTQPGYFYITAKPATQEQGSGAVSVVRRVGVKIELANVSQTNTTTGNQTNQTTTTTITSGGGGGTAGQQTTTTTTSGGTAGINQTNATKTTTTTLKNQTNQPTTTTTAKKVNSQIDESVVEKQVIEALNKTTNLTNRPSFGIIDIVKIALMIGVLVGLIYLIFYVIQIV
jgi:cobalamin biosynthesis Mg chelatase CobN